MFKSRRLSDACHTEVTSADVHYSATGILARREHARKELRQKLQLRFPEFTQLDSVLDALAEAGLQCDQRFAEAYVKMCKRKGRGPNRIAMELREKGVVDSLISCYLNSADTDWYDLALDIRQRRFGDVAPEDMKSKAKQMRFLQYRGFTTEQINASFNS